MLNNWRWYIVSPDDHRHAKLITSVCKHAVVTDEGRSGYGAWLKEKADARGRAGLKVEVSIPLHTPAFI
jgi:hypothetical protein